MRAILAAEHFDFTPAMHSHVSEQMRKLEAFLPSDAVLRVFLGMCAKGEFTVLLRAHWRGHDHVVKAAGPDLYVLMNQSSGTLKQVFQKHKERRIARRRTHEKSQRQEHDQSA